MVAISLAFPDLDGVTSCDLRLSGNSNGGLAHGGLSYLSTIDHDCLQFVGICDAKSLYERPRMRTIPDNCVQIAESGLKLPFESPHLDFPKIVVIAI